MAALIVAAVVGVAGLALTGLGYLLDPSRTLHAYLAAYSYVATIAFGALVLLLVGYAANARWMAAIRRLHDGVTLAFVPLAILFVPIGLGLPELYSWADPDAVWGDHAAHVLDEKRAYLNPAAFLVRAAIYFAIWIAAAELLRRWSRARDGVTPAGDPEAGLGRERVFASVMLPAVGLAITFAAFDWLMTLDPLWYSSIFGVYVAAGGFVSGVAILVVVCRAAVARGAVPLTGHHFHALGRLLLGFTVFWAYAAYFQVFLIQIADRPGEVTFYLRRGAGGWDVVALVMALAKFAVPFFALLPRAPKFRSRYLAAVAIWILAAHYVDVYWLVLPAHDPAFTPHWVDLTALAGVAGVTVAWCAWRQRRASLVATGDPFLPEGLRYASST